MSYNHIVFNSSHPKIYSVPLLFGVFLNFSNMGLGVGGEKYFV